MASSPLSPKARHLERSPFVPLTYRTSTHDTCTARCRAGWLLDPQDRRALWDRFVSAPPPLGYDPRIIPGWDSPDAPSFGVLQLSPERLEVLTGETLMSGQRPLIWRQD